MAEQWYAVVQRATGVLVSTGTVIAGPLPGNLQAIPLAQRPDFSLDKWDATLKAIVPDTDALGVQTLKAALVAEALARGVVISPGVLDLLNGALRRLS